MFRIIVGLLVFILVPAFSSAQPVDAKAKTVEYVRSLYEPKLGAFKPTPDGKPGLRATSAAIRTLKYLGADLPEKPTLTTFVLSCYDAKTGGFHEPGGEPDVFTTAVGVMAAVELEIPRDKYSKSLPYLRENSRTFEDVRIAAAAVEAWGVKDCPFDLTLWIKAADEHVKKTIENPVVHGAARDIGSWAALKLRLGGQVFDPTVVFQVLHDGQRPDGAWSKAGAPGSDLETTYRVMRALMLLKKSPKEPAKLRNFLRDCRNDDGGYGVTPDGDSNIAGTYYATIVSKWLDEMDK